MTPPADRLQKERPRWVIRIVYPNGGVAWLRHGDVAGVGAIVRFRDKKTADINLEFIREGLDAGVVASVVRVGSRQPDGVTR